MSQDFFVGVVAIGVGVLFLAAAVWNSDAFFQFWAARLMQKRWGRSSARALYVVLGFAMIFLGLVIASGWTTVSDPDEAARHSPPIGHCSPT